MPEETRITKKIFILDYISILLIGILCFSYSILGNYFAKIHLSLFFLNFPIFIGEVFLAVLLILFFIKINLLKIKPSKFHYLTLSFFTFIFIKTIIGYTVWGPLALRNAAMFYYVLFAIIGFYFYKGAVFNNKKKLRGLLLFLIVISLLYMPRHYSFYSYFALLLILSYKDDSRIIKFSGYILSFYFIFRYCFLRSGPKGYVISGILAFLFLIIAVNYSFNKSKIKNRLLFLLIVFLFLLFSVILLCNKTMKERLNVLADFDSIRQEFRTQLSYLKLPDLDIETYPIQPHRYVQYPEKVKLYEDDVSSADGIRKESTSFSVGDKKEDVHLNTIKKIYSDIENDIEKLDKIVSVAEPIVEVKPMLSKIDLTETTELTKLEVKARDMDLTEIIEIILPIKDQIKAIETSGFSQVCGEERERDILRIKNLIDKITLEGKGKNREEIERDYAQEIQEVTMLVKRIINEVQELKNLKPRTIHERNIITTERDVYSILWRLFIAKDMLDESIKNKAFLGMDFGKPIRSPTMERLRYIEGTGWSLAEWVGWIEPHNSYLHVLYRTGIVGFLFLVTMFTIFLRMAFCFIMQRSFIGITLCSALCYYLIIPNFIVFLELPQFVIPYWSLFGMTYAFYKHFK